MKNNKTTEQVVIQATYNTKKIVQYNITCYKTTDYNK